MAVIGNKFAYTRPLEVLSPAGDMERLEVALDFGADAVYLGGKMFGMRAASPNFTAEELKIACDKAHAIGKRVYLTCNTLPRNSEIIGFEGFVKDACSAGVDALIANDIGVFAMIKRYAPDMEIHMSTQTGIVNYATATEFYNMGAKRVVLARELSLEEIAEIRAKTPKDLEIEVFVHGAMCVSFSGRCLLSQYIIDRDANRGACAQPCRWGYHLMEEKRPNEFYPVYEDESGTYILNAKDLCMIDHIDKLAEAGVDSFKIEGRAKNLPITFRSLQTLTGALWTSFCRTRTILSFRHGYMTRFSRSVTALTAQDFSLVTRKIASIMKIAVISVIGTLLR